MNTPRSNPIGKPSPKLDYPWQRDLEAALLSEDVEKVRAHTLAAEGAIFVRQQELAQSSDGQAESAVIQSALKVLRMIQKEKLDYPQWHECFSGYDQQ
jgi:hypothetical protein